MNNSNIKMALQSIRSARWRSFLTMLGVIIGVLSVVTTVSLGEGVKQQIRSQLQHRGGDIITVLPGNRIERNQNGGIRSFNLFSTSADGVVFSELEYKTLENLENVDKVTPFAKVTGLIEADGREYRGNIIATTESLPSMLNQKIEYGSFFSKEDSNKNFSIIGKRVAEDLYQENVPVGRTLTIRGHNFVVRGVFEEFQSVAPVLLSDDHNKAAFIPYDLGKEIMGGSINIQQILVKPKEGVDPSKLAEDIRQELLRLHSGQEDFTVLKAEETLEFAGNILNMLTGLIAGIAAISLVVGGIGIMNIMLVAVTERTSEIGVRKAIGATNRQILHQFLTEAVILSVFGGIIGVLFSLGANILLRIFTNLQPVITLEIIALAVGVSMAVGIIFGVTPALRAARKNPIDALRYE